MWPDQGKKENNPYTPHCLSDNTRLLNHNHHQTQEKPNSNTHLLQNNTIINKYFTNYLTAWPLFTKEFYNKRRSIQTN